MTAAWDDVEEVELEPPALDRLTEIRVPVLVLLGALDLDTTADVAHLPSLERPDDFLALLREEVTRSG